MSGRRIIIACIVLLVMVLPQAAFATTSINVRPGLSGLYRPERPVQLNINIVNKGPAIENAVLEVKVNQKSTVYGPGNNAVYRQKVKVPAHSSVNSAIIIPGYMAQNTPHVYLIANGSEVARDVVQGVAVSSRMVGISIGEQPLANGLPVWVDNNMDDLTLKYLSPVEVPVDIIGLNIVDLIIMDHRQVNELTAAQVENVRRWVALGGNLLLSGGAGAGEGQPFADISPVKVSGETRVSGSLDELRAGTETIPAASGIFIAGEELAVSGNLPVIAKRNFGRGLVIYSAVRLEDLKPEDVKLWSLLFQGLNCSDYDMLRTTSDSLVQNSANIPQLQIPSLKLLAGIWAGYMLVLAPGLYFLLKRYNRRDWAWLCIPLISLVSAVAVYFWAPFHRLSGPLGQTLAVVDILDDNVTEVKAGSSCVLPRGGKLVLAVPGQSLVTPEIRYQSNARENPPIIEYRADGQEVYFNDVEFWSLRQVSVYKVLDKFDQIQGELSLDGNSLTGTLVNNTSVDLGGCLLTVGEKALEIGNLPVGKQVDININLDRAKFIDWKYDFEDRYPNFDDRNITAYTGPAQVSDANVKEATASTAHPEILLVGYADNLSSIVELIGAEAYNYGSALVRQKLSLSVPGDGKFRLPAGLVSPQVIESRGGIEHTSEGRIVHGDQVKLEYNLRLPGKYRKYEFTAVDLPAIARDKNYQLKIYNWQEKQWEELQVQQNRLSGDQLKPYISEDYRLQLSVQSLQGVKNIMPLPGLAVEGVVVND